MYPYLNFRVFDFSIPVEALHVPRWYRKEHIENPELAKKPDWLINLYFSKPDYEDPHLKTFYSSYLALKISKDWLCAPSDAASNRSSLIPNRLWLLVPRNTRKQHAKPGTDFQDHWQKFLLDRLVLSFWPSESSLLLHSHLVLPFATYGATATAVANLRGKKDDFINHFIAGATAGFYVGFTRMLTRS